MGDTIAVQATFSAPVAVRGVPGIDLQVGERVVVARYVSGSGTDRLRFEYVTRLGDYDENGIGLSLERDSESPFRLDGATIIDTQFGGNAVDLRRTTLTGGGGNHRVEARPPAATGVSMASSPASGDTYGAGETVTVRLAMRADVTVVLPGRPHVWLEVGGAVRRAEYSGPVGSATRALEFSYTVQEGDLDTDGVRLCSSDRPGIDCGRIHLNGGTIRAARGGLDAELGTPRQSAQAGHKVDAVTRCDATGAAQRTACGGDQGAAPDWALVPSGVERFGGQVPAAVHHLDDAQRPRRPGRSGRTTSSCRGGRMPDISAIRPYKDGLPGGREHRGPCNARDEHLRHRCGPASDLLAERQQGRRQLQRLLRRQLGRTRRGKERERERGATPGIRRVDRNGPITERTMGRCIGDVGKVCNCGESQ